MKKKKWILWVIGIPLLVALDWFILHKLGVTSWKLLLCMLAMEGIGIWYLMDNPAHYKADLVTITPEIKIPAPMGQGQHGSARFLKKEEYEQTFASVVLDKNTTQIENASIVLGMEKLKGGKERVWYLPDNRHSLTWGATRSGKSRRLVMETIGLEALAGNSMIIPDVKGELYDYTAPFLRDMDYETIVIDFDEKLKSGRTNFLQPVIDYIDAGNLPDAIDATWDIVSQLVGEAKGEKIWNDGECATIAGAIMAVSYDNRNPENQKYRNMTNVYYFLTNMCTPIQGVLPLELYIQQIPDSHPAKGMFAVAGVAPQETRGGFYTSAILTLRLFTNPLINQMTNRSDFNLKDIGRRRVALYIILPEDNMTYHPIATLLMTQVYTTLSRLAKENGGVLPHVVDYIWDETGNFTKIPAFPHWLTVSGGKGIRFHLFYQDMGQLEALYEKEGAKTIKNNCDFKIYLRSGDGDTREEISKDLGEYTTKGYSVNYGKGKNQTSSINLVGRRLLTAEEIGRIRTPYALIMNDRHPAITTLPDLSAWSLNTRFGMGDMEHNRQLRLKRRKERPEHRPEEVELWNIWKKYQAILQAAAEKKQKQKEEMKHDNIG